MAMKKSNMLVVHVLTHRQKTF